ncbi:MAG: hypothetical protein QHJ73_06115 [Armatimonadota bacterium]|nr:hypothetical protein [Armatimonadota bacterium]
MQLFRRVTLTLLVLVWVVSRAGAAPTAPDPLLALIPEDAAGALLADLRAETESMRWLVSLHTPEQQRLFGAGALLFLQTVLSQLGADLDIQTQVLPLLTRRVVVCFPGERPNQRAQPVFLLETAGGTAGAARVETLLQETAKGGRLVAAEPVEGEPAWQSRRAPAGGCVVRVGAVLALGARDNLASVVRRAHAATPAPLSPLSAMLAATPPGLVRLAIRFPDPRPEGQPRFPIPGAPGFCGSLRFDATGATVEAIVPAGGAGPVQTLAGVKPTFGESVSALPASAAAVLVVARPGQIFHAFGIPFADAIAFGAIGPRPLRPLGKAFAPILSDVLGQEAAVALLPNDQTTDWVMAFTSAQPATLGNRVAAFVQAGQGDPDVTWTATPIGENPAWSIRFTFRPDRPPMELHFTAPEDRLLIASSRTALEAAMAVVRKAAPPVSEAPWYAADAELLGPNPLLRVSGDARRVGEVLARMVAAESQRGGAQGPPGVSARYLIPVVNALLEGIRGVQGGMSASETGLRFVAHLGIDYPKVAALGLAFPAAAGGMALAPRLARGRRSPQNAQCASNVKQLCVAAQMYALDHKKLPSALGWVEELEPYFKDRALLRCPNAPEGQVCSYAFNRALSELPPNEIANPAATVLFYETTSMDACPTGGGEDLPPQPRHPGGHTFGFVDGHVQSHPRWPEGGVR